LFRSPLSNGAVSVEAIPTPFLSNSTTLQSITWKADDSSALITGPWGKYVLYDGQLATFISSPISDRSIDASAWDPKTNMALLAGNNDTIAEFDGTNTNTSIAPPSTNCTRDNTCVYHSVRWSPSGSYALIGGDNSTLYKYQQRSLTKAHTAAVSRAYAHPICPI